MTPKLVIFDCDGVLVDSEPPTNTLLARSLSAHGLPMTEDRIADLFVGGTIQGVYTESKRLGANLPEDWIETTYAAIFAVLAEGVPVFDGLFDLLDALENRQIATAIASNGPMQKMAVSLGPSGLFDRFAGRIYSGHDYAPKPDPAMIHHAMQVAGCTPARTVFVDDSVSGCSAGLAAGVQVLGFAPEEPHPAKLEAIGATPVRSMAAVQQLLGV